MWDVPDRHLRGRGLAGRLRIPNVHPDHVRRKGGNLRLHSRRLRWLTQLRHVRWRNMWRRRRPEQLRSRVLHGHDVRGPERAMRPSRGWLRGAARLRALPLGPNLPSEQVRAAELHAAYVRAGGGELRRSVRWLRRPARLRSLRLASDVRRGRDAEPVRRRDPVS